MSAIPLTRKITPDEARDWAEPLPLIQRQQPEPYPVGALPDPLRAVVEELQSFLQAPTALIANSVLGALSAAAQGLVNVERDRGLCGPASLYLLTIAESGERKSATDTLVLEGIREFEAEEAEKAKPLLARHRAQLRAWEAKVDALVSNIRSLAKEGRPTWEAENKLQELERNKPQPPLIPRVLWDDTTTEALVAGMASNWPAAAIISAEAGVVFGGHSLQKDRQVAGLATINKLWSGEPIRADRKTEGASVILDTGRLTLGLAVQEDVVREFISRSKGLARGSGFLARFLIAWPESTQGSRLYRPSTTTAARGAYTERLKKLIDQTEVEVGGCKLKTLPLSAEARARWVAFHDDIERQLGQGGELADARDSASKAAENVARVAALFHVYERGTSGEVGAAHVDRAAALVAWYLGEARRFLGEIALPPDLLAAVKLDQWLREQPNVVTARDAMRLGPIRQRAALDRALAELEAHHRVRVEKQGKKSVILLNPALREA